MVTSYPEVIYNNMDVVRQSDINFLYPFINLADKPSFKRQMMKALHDYGFTKTEIDNASEKAFAELQHYKQDIRSKGEEVLKWLDEHDERAIVLAGRPYHIDPEINHGIPEMITSYGMCVLTEDSISHLGNLERPLIVMDQWMYHSRLYSAANYVKTRDDLDLIH